MSRRLVPLALALTALVLGPMTGWAADDDVPLFRTNPSVQDTMKDLPPFLRDTRLHLQLRSYYRNNEPSPDTFQEAWAAGGWLAYQSGWLADFLAIGVTGYLSLPLYAPIERDGTLLVHPGQQPIAVVGEAYVKLKFWEQVLTGGRQRIDVGYVNSHDVRMVPNTFEALLLGGKPAEWLAYTAGYVFTIKPREEHIFLEMAERAGAANSDDGLGLVGFRLTPWKPLIIDVSTAYGVNTFNSLLAYVEYAQPLAEDVTWLLGAQYHDQRSVGDELVGRFNTFNIGAHTRLEFFGAYADLMFHKTGSAASISSPYGAWPGYLSMTNKDFDRADELAWGLKVGYDFGRLGAAGLTAFFWFGQGTGADNTSGGGAAPNIREYDFDVTYTVPRGVMQGFQFKARLAVVEQKGQTPLPDIRLIMNWPIKLF